MRFPVLVLFVVGCNPDLPVKYEVCDEQGKDCQLAGRFKTFEACKWHEMFNRSLCCGKSIGAEDGPCAVEAREGRIVCMLPKDLGGPYRDQGISSSRCTH